MTNEILGDPSDDDFIVVTSGDFLFGLDPENQTATLEELPQSVANAGVRVGMELRRCVRDDGPPESGYSRGKKGTRSGIELWTFADGEQEITVRLEFKQPTYETAEAQTDVATKNETAPTDSVVPPDERVDGESSSPENCAEFVRAEKAKLERERRRAARPKQRSAVDENYRPWPTSYPSCDQSAAAQVFRHFSPRRGAVLYDHPRSTARR